MTTTEHRIDLTPAVRYNSGGRSTGHGKAVMTYRGASLGEPSDQPLFDAARQWWYGRPSLCRGPYVGETTQEASTLNGLYRGLFNVEVL